MTRDEAQQVATALASRYPGGSVDVTRVFGGVQVAATDGRGWIFIHAADGIPLLTLLGAARRQAAAIRCDVTPWPRSTPSPTARSSAPLSSATETR